MRRSILLCGLVLGLAAEFFPRGANHDVDAGTAMRLDVSGLVDQAELVFEGHTRSATVIQTSPRRIETEYTFEVDRWLLGSGGSQVSVRIPGGLLPDGSGLLLPGMPVVQEGEDVLLFLSEAGSTGVRMPVGLSQGKFRVERSLSGERRLSRQHGSLTVVDSNTGTTSDAGGAEVFGYSEVIAEIHAAVERKGSKR